MIAIPENIRGEKTERSGHEPKRILFEEESTALANVARLAVLAPIAHTSPAETFHSAAIAG